MKNEDNWKKEVLSIFKKIDLHKKPYDIIINGVSITVFPKVFSPKYFTDSKWFAENVPEIVGNKTLLEIGTATGIIAVFCALNGAKVVTTDISLEAVKNAKANFARLGLNIPVYKGDMYSCIPKDEWFEFIFWNHPFSKGGKARISPLLKSGFDYKYQGMKKYIEGAFEYLTDDGRLLLGTGSGADIKEIERIAWELGYKLILIKKENVPLVEESKLDNDYRIYEFVR